jgi:hypothetical protein
MTTSNKPAGSNLHGPTKFSVVAGDIKTVSADILLLRDFYGCDREVAEALVQSRVCDAADLHLASDRHNLLPSHGAVKADNILFLGTQRSSEFSYDALYDFACQAVQIIAHQLSQLDRLILTIHGVGCGLDAEESLICLVRGFQTGLQACQELTIREIQFVERNVSRALQLSSALHNFLSQEPPVEEGIPTVPAEYADVATAGKSSLDDIPGPSAADAISATSKRHVFVAMPFSEEFDDVFEFGIYRPIRDCGFICEKTNETAYTGDIWQRIKERIESAAIVVADMSTARPNVYLEVGYAWGKGIPVIFVARHGEELHFDVSRHRCIYYKSIRQLGRDRGVLIRGLFDVQVADHSA